MICMSINASRIKHWFAFNRFERNSNIHVVDKNRDGHNMLLLIFYLSMHAMHEMMKKELNMNIEYMRIIRDI